MGRGIGYERQLKGRAVVGSGGNVLGDVDDVLLDPENGRIVTLGMRLRPGVAKSIGVRESLFRRAHADIPWELVQGVSETIVLRVNTPELGARLRAESP